MPASEIDAADTKEQGKKMHCYGGLFNFEIEKIWLPNGQR
jgi:hypothetical protein